MRFLADMDVASGVAEWLRAEGHDVRHLREENLQRLPDDRVFAMDGAERRILLPFDLDFGEILALSGGQSVSVILFRFTTHERRM